MDYRLRQRYTLYVVFIYHFDNKYLNNKSHFFSIIFEKRVKRWHFKYRSYCNTYCFQVYNLIL
uniref:Uncharacterized protein n=1 Tax=Anguilla anguilla TaxID=7936 RepID=A0A0E9X6R0_ANGAN